MKTIGLVGGMSCESTVLYYRIINERVRKRLGGLHSAKVVLNSVDFSEIEEMQRAGAWDRAGAFLGAAAQVVESAGANVLVLCTNTMHKVATAIEKAVSIPFLHIADPTGVTIRAAGHTIVGLLATSFTMEQAFYKERLLERHGIRVLLPDEKARAFVHRVIYEELCRGTIAAPSRQGYRAIMAKLVADGAQGIILGCTEIALLVGQGDASVPLYDTTLMHAQAAADYAMEIE